MHTNVIVGKGEVHHEKPQSWFRLSSMAFQDGGTIPIKYTAYGEDVNPPIQIFNIPDETKSLALIVDDPDTKTELYVHWLVKNIPTNTKEIIENSNPGEEVMNSFVQKKYRGPMHPRGNHRYMFKLYALKCNQLPAENYLQFYTEVEKKKIAMAYMMGRFTDQQYC